MTPLSLLEVVGDPPPIYRNLLSYDFNLTIERPPGGGGSPLVLSNVKTASHVCARWRTTCPKATCTNRRLLSTWPPGGVAARGHGHPPAAPDDRVLRVTAPGLGQTPAMGAGGELARRR